LEGVLQLVPEPGLEPGIPGLKSGMVTGDDYNHLFSKLSR